MQKSSRAVCDAGHQVWCIQFESGQAFWKAYGTLLMAFSILAEGDSFLGAACTDGSMSRRGGRAPPHGMAREFFGHRYRCVGGPASSLGDLLLLVANLECERMNHEPRLFESFPSRLRDDRNPILVTLVTLGLCPQTGASSCTLPQSRSCRTDDCPHGIMLKSIKGVDH